MRYARYGFGAFSKSVLRGVCMSEGKHGDGSRPLNEDMERAVSIIEKYRAEMAKKIIGQKALVDGILAAAVAGGHALLEGVPGVAKTLAVRTFASLFSLDFKRLQFTPDLLPSDLIGTLMYNRQNGEFSVRKGPVFTHIVLADEINRAPAKVQSALLEAMAERQVTIGEESLPLPFPFTVLATQNPVEHEGTYRLPEAELDRFFIKLTVDYPSMDEEAEIVSADFESAKRGAPSTGGQPKAVFSAEDLECLCKAASAVYCDESIVRYIVSIVSATRPASRKARIPEPNRMNAKAEQGNYLRYIYLGASPRASVALHSYSKIRALFSGKSWVSPEDVKDAAYDVLRHRISLSYEAGASDVSSDDVVSMILGAVAQP